MRLTAVPIQWIESECLLIPLCALWMPPTISQKGDRFPSYRFGYHVDAPALDSSCKKAHFIIGDLACNLFNSLLCRLQYRLLYINRGNAINNSPVTRIESEVLQISLLRFVDASRDKPERRSLSVLSLRLPRRRAFAGWSM